MHLKRILPGAVFLVIACAANAYSCQCRERQPPCAQYWEADAVFVGSVIKIEFLGESRPFGKANEYNIGFERVHFNLERAYRGVEGESVEFREYMSSCRFGFAEGKRYLVYAYSDPSSKTLSTHTCSRTTEISKAAADLDFLQSLNVKRQETLILGIVADGNKRLGNVKVVAEGAGRRYQTVSDQQGWFRLAVAQPGTYRVRVLLPSYSDVSGTEDQLELISRRVRTKRHTIIEYEVTIKTGTCDFIDVPLYISWEDYQRHIKSQNP